MRRVVIKASVDSFSGYGTFVTRLCKELESRGIWASVRPIRASTPFGALIPAEMTSRMVMGPQPEPWEVLFGPAAHLPTPGKNTFYWTMTESEFLSPIQTELLRRAKLVATANEMSRQALARSGLKPFGVIPLGIDLNAFQPADPTSNSPFEFAAAGRPANGQDRKGIDRVIAAFLAAFPKSRDARLSIKTDPDCSVGSTDDRVKIIAAHWSDAEIASWLRACNCFVTGSAQEGFGLWPLQAMACGRAVIGSVSSGMDYLTEENCLHVEVERRAAGDGNLGYWNVPTIESIAQRMLDAYRNQSMVGEMGNEARRTAAAYSTGASADKLIAELEKCGALERKPWFARLRSPVNFSRSKKSYCHISSKYPCSDADSERIAFAQSTWPVDRRWQVLMVENSQLPREFVDESRRLPFVRDMITLAARTGKSVVLTNSDLCLSVGIVMELDRVLSKSGACFGFRREFPKLTEPVPDDKIESGDYYPGFDLFAFTDEWIKAHMEEIPDMVIGAEGWDSVLSALIKVTCDTHDCRIDNQCYHVSHVPVWRNERFKISSQKYNHTLAHQFFARHRLTDPIPLPGESGQQVVPVVNLI